MDLFEKRTLSPMLIGAEGEAFDSPDYIYELKLDGIRCLAYLDSSGSVALLNKRGIVVTQIYPELSGIYKQVKGRCILDGEVSILINGRTEFSAIQRRALMSNRTKIQMAADRQPVNFTAFDLLYLDGCELLDKPIEKRKDLLRKTVSDSPLLAVSRVIDEHGIALFDLTTQQGLEGIVAKRKGSLYYPGKRTREWIKSKNMQDDDFIILGYIPQGGILLGQYEDSSIHVKGRVISGLSGEDMRRIRSVAQCPGPPDGVPDQSGAVWIDPVLVCTVKYMELTSAGAMRQPVFKGFREDKIPTDCVAQRC